METDSKKTTDLSNTARRNIQKIRQKILFGAAGPWTKHVNALLFFGIDVKDLLIESEKMNCSVVNKEAASIQVSKGQPLTISEWRSLYRNLSILLTNQQKEIKVLTDHIQYLKSRPIEEENKELEAKNRVLMNEIQKLKENEIDRLLREMGRAPRKPNPSEVYLSKSR
jgi:hypothetical protein